jgi:hypothetical protein
MTDINNIIDAFSHMLNEDTSSSMNKVTIYRYTFSSDFTEELFTFAKIHQYDDRHDFKDAWNVWVDENNDMIEMEIRRLQSLHYTGDIVDKMYKSARYYFRSKSIETKEPNHRKKYIVTIKPLIVSMNSHIMCNINELSKFKPSEGFDDFCHTHKEILKEQIQEFMKNGLTDVTDMKNRIKKTYKNRYFVISRNLQKC